MSWEDEVRANDPHHLTIPMPMVTARVASLEGPITEPMTTLDVRTIWATVTDPDTHFTNEADRKLLLTLLQCLYQGMAESEARHGTLPPPGLSPEMAERWKEQHKTMRVVLEETMGMNAVSGELVKRQTTDDEIIQPEGVPTAIQIADAYEAAVSKKGKK